MSLITFEKGQKIFDDNAAHIFNVAAVDEEGRATELTAGQDFPGLSRALKTATAATGARSAYLASQNSDVVTLRHTAHPTSPHFEA